MKLKVTSKSMGSVPQTPHLGPDKVLSFIDEAHYSKEFSDNLSHGRTFASIDPGLKLGSELTFEVEHPTSQKRLSIIGRIVFKSDQQVGFELSNFNDELKSSLENLGHVEEPEPVEEPDPVEEPTLDEQPDDSQLDDLPGAEEWQEPPMSTPFGRKRPRTRDALRSLSRRAPKKKIATRELRKKHIPSDHELLAQEEVNAGQTQDLSQNNSESNEDLDFSIPHLDRRSKLYVENSFQLLGLYISQIRHGYLTYRSEKEAEIDDVVSIRLVCGHTLGLTGDLVKKEGNVQTVKLDDTWSVEALLKETSSEWMQQIRGLADIPAPKRKPRPRDETIASPSPPEIKAPTAITEEPPAPAEANRETSKPELTPPRLKDNLVVFEDKASLEREYSGNICNGGLAVKASPIPIREQRTLSIAVKNQTLNCSFEATVVYANDGTVGFHIGDSVMLLQVIKAFLDGEHASPTTQPKSPKSKAQVFSGRIARPSGLLALIDLSRGRIEDETELNRCNTLLLLEYIARTKLSGTLHINRKDEKKTVYFKNGNICFVESIPDQEEQLRLGRILIHHKKVTEPALRDALEYAEQRSLPVGQALLSQGHIKNQTLAAALREQMRKKLESAFEWTTGTHEFKETVKPPIEADLITASGLSIITRRIRQRLELITSNEMEALFSPSATRKLETVTDLDKAVQGMGLQQKELSFLSSQLNSSRSLRESITGSPLGRLGTLRLIGLSLALNLVNFTDGKGAAMGRKAPPRKPTHLRDQDALKSSLQEHLDLMQEQNFFEVLGVHWSASHRSFAKARQKVMTRFNLDQGPIKEAETATKNIARSIHKRIDEAFAVLEDREERIRYRKKLFDSTERQYSAEMLIKQGEVLVMRGDRVAGLEAFETAFELAPSNKIKALLEAARDGD